MGLPYWHSLLLAYLQIAVSQDPHAGVPCVFIELLHSQQLSAKGPFVLQILEE